MGLQINHDCTPTYRGTYRAEDFNDVEGREIDGWLIGWLILMQQRERSSMREVG